MGIKSNCQVKEITLFTIEYAFNIVISFEYMKTKGGGALSVNVECFGRPGLPWEE